MLDSIAIKNFRLFKRLELERLGRVNLIVGKNNSGKSTLLEAVRLYARHVDSGVLIDLVASRQELQSGGHDFRHLFHGHRLPGFNDEGIRLGPAKAPSIKSISGPRPIAERWMKKVSFHDNA